MVCVLQTFHVLRNFLYPVRNVSCSCFVTCFHVCVVFFSVICCGICVCTGYRSIRRGTNGDPKCLQLAGQGDGTHEVRTHAGGVPVGYINHSIAEVHVDVLFR